MYHDHMSIHVSKPHMKGIQLKEEALGGLRSRESGILKYPRQSITPSPDMLAPVKISVTWKVAHTGDCIEMGR